ASAQEALQNQQQYGQASNNPLLLPSIWAQTAAGQRKRPFGSLATMSSKFVIMAVNR
ncbi:hypothetical protein GGI1_01683, partial [Acidithiobacillus sp. GGI-221]